MRRITGWIFPLTSVTRSARINCELDMQNQQVAIKVALRPVGRCDGKGSVHRPWGAEKKL